MVVCIDEAFGDTAPVARAVARWDAALCGVVRLKSETFDGYDLPGPQCSAVIYATESWYPWVQSVIASDKPGEWTLGIAKPEERAAWIIVDRALVKGGIEDAAAHEIGHLLGADHATLTRYPQGCVSRGSAVQAAYEQGGRR